MSPIVDSHSHIFNAEDLPIDGFLKKMSPVPGVLTGVLSLPFDQLAQWAAPGSDEAAHLLGMLRRSPGVEQEVLEPPAASPDADLLSESELERRLIELWPLATPIVPGELEAVALSAAEADPTGPTITAMLATRIEQASPEQLEELDAWLAEWGEPTAETPWLEEQAAAEGLGDVVARAKALRDAAVRFLQALRLVMRHRYLIAAELAATYPEVDLFVPALVDFSHASRDDPATSIPEQIAIHSLVAKLAAVGRIPGAPEVRIHPMVGFCPHREVAESELARWDVDQGTPNEYVPYAEPTTATAEDRYRPALRFDPERAKSLAEPHGDWHSARLDIGHVRRSLDLVRHAVELGGFAGVKLYPPSGFLPIDNVGRFGEVRGQRLDAALRALYAYCESQQVPILTHAARSMGFERGFDDLAAPTAWRRVLAEYPALRLCFGHFGHLQGIGPDPAHPLATSWPSRFLELVDGFENVYADVGNSKYVGNEAYRTEYTAFLQGILGPRDTADPTLLKRRRRLMFGSDYWMNSFGPDHRDSFRVFSGGIEELLGSPVRGMFMGGNALRWLGITDEADAVDIENLNRQRLIAFYGSVPLPPWLAA